MRINRIITLNGSPQLVGSFFNAQPNAPFYADRVFIQMLTGGVNLGYVMDGIPYGTSPTVSTVTQLTAQLAAASASAPGGSYSDTAYVNNGGGIDLNQMWVQGTNNETLVVSANLHV